MKYKTAIFDMDGVVIDSERLFDDADSEFLSSHGLEFDIKELALATAGLHFEDAVRYMKQHYGISGSVKDLATQRHEILVSHYRIHLRYIPGFKRFYSLVVKQGIK